jgi:hypothetical protein
MRSHFIKVLSSRPRLSKDEMDEMAKTGKFFVGDALIGSDGNLYVFDGKSFINYDSNPVYIIDADGLPLRSMKHPVNNNEDNLPEDLSDDCIEEIDKEEMGELE